jgi:HB1, ASXL, restriction endonuclease HTH domain
MRPKVAKTNASMGVTQKSKQAAKKATTKPAAKPAIEVRVGAAAETKSDAAEAQAAPGKPAAEKKLGAIDAAVKLLRETGQAMTCREMIDAMATKGYWSSPGGKTPQATLYSAILREIATKGAQARFKKTERGKFALLS